MALENGRVDNVLSLMEELTTKGIYLWREGDDIRFQGPSGAMTAELKVRIRASKSALLKLLADLRWGRIEPVERKDTYELSPAQRRLWILSQLEEASGAYHMPGVFEMEGALDVESLKRALQKLVERHEVLRTRFVVKDGEPWQWVESELEFCVREEDVSAQPDGTLEKRIENGIAERFDLEKGPLLRSELFRIGANKWVFVFVMHHIVGDGWSVGVLMKEIMELYRSLRAGEEARLPVLEVQYKDYAVWQNRWLMGSEKANESRDYWHAKLGGELPVLEMPLDYVRPATKGYRGAVHFFEFSREEHEGLKALARQKETTLFAVMLAAIKTLLYRYTGQEDIIVGVPVAGREHWQLRDQVGFYVNTLALRDEVRGEMSFGELIDAVKKTVLEGCEHQYYPFDRLVEELDVKRDPSRHPLFEVMVVQDDGWGNPVLDGIGIRAMASGRVTAKFDLTVSLGEKDGGLTVDLEYDCELFGRDRMERMGEHFKVLVGHALKDLGVKVGEIEILPDWERKKVLEEFNRTEVNYSGDKTIVQLFEEQVERSPEAVALVCEGREMSYGQLNARANQLGRLLREKHGVKADDIVGILCERSFEMIVGILGVMKAGGAYLPIDPEYPLERQRFMVEDSRASVVVGCGRCLEKVAGSFERLQIDDDGIYRDATTNLKPVSCSANLAYVIYTSGSTGTPKGAMIEQRSIVNLCLWHQRAFHITQNDRATVVAGVGFDAIIWEIFPGLISGVALHLLPSELVLAPAGLAKYIDRYRITIAFLPTPLCDAFTRLNCDGLRILFTGGERLSDCRSQKYEIVNVYGVAECTVASSVFRTRHAIHSPPIGMPIGNTRFYVLASGNALQPIGVSGELCISGVQVGRGYVNRPELTGEKFVENPFELGQRMYRTGDLGRWLPDGNLEYLGRIDNQVKVRGYRIELGEIEAALGRIAGVKSAVVIAWEAGGEKELCGYYVGEAGEKQLRVELRKELPEYMVPARVVQLEAMPLTSNGKVDRKSLPKPDLAGCEGECEAPGNELEEQLARIWAEIFKRDRVGVSSNFFELGGHSLRAMQLVGRIERELGKDISLRDIFEEPTVRALARRIHEKAAEESFGRIEVAEEGESYELSNAQKRLWVLSQLGEASGAYHMPGVYGLEGDLDEEVLNGAFHQLVKRHEVLRTRFTMKGGEPRQVVDNALRFALDRQDLRGTGEEQIREVARAEVLRPFDLEKGPVLRAKLLHVGETKWVLVFVMHHIAGDGWSVGVLIRDVLELYRALQAGEEARLPVLKVQYKDYAVWRNRWLGESEKARKSRAYWHGKLGGDLPVLDLPLDYARPAQKTFEGGVCRFELGTDAVEGLKKLARQKQTTFFVVMLGLVKVLLHRYSGQEDIVVGTAVAGRDQWQLEDQVGFYVNTLALRDEVRGEESYLELLERVKQTVLECHEHQYYPFDVLVDELDVKRDLSRHPIFEVMVVQNEEWGRVKTEAVKARALKSEERLSKFDLTVNYGEQSDGVLVVELEYDRALFSAGRMQRMGEHLRTLVDNVVKEPLVKVGEVEIMAQWERRKVLEEFNATVADYPLHKTIVELFEEQVAATPEALALVYGEEEMSYGELNRRANQLGRVLREYGVGPEQIVAIVCERSFEMVIGIMGIMKAGGAYLPIDPAYPEERKKFLLEDSDSRVVVGQGQCLSWVTGDYKKVDLCLQELSRIDSTNLERVAGPENLAYVIYTSGSTGKPKGGMIEQRSIVNRLLWMRDQYSIGSDEVILQKTTYTFDVSVWELILPLITGAKMALLPPGDEKDPVAIERVVMANRVTMLHFVPSMLAAFFEQLPPAGQLGVVRRVICSGEALSLAHKTEFFRKLPQIELHNLYGPTEAAVDVTYFHVRESSEAVPIGRPVANTQVYIINATNVPSPIGLAGELCIGGVQVGRGYLNRPQLTARQFVQNPWMSDGKLYRTGDLARWREDGNLEYIGRMDQQVKVRGYRIELGEIEAALGRVLGVWTSAVVVREDDGEKELCGYYVGEISVKQLKEALRKELPEYMVPGRLVQLEAMPLASNGKVDRKALPRVDDSLDNAYVAPRTETESVLAQLWAEVLKVPRISISDDFFELGGNSLKAVRLVVSVNERFRMRIPLSELLQARNIVDLALLIDGILGVRTEAKSDAEVEEILI